MGSFGKLFRFSSFLLFLAIAIATPALPQTQPTSTDANLKAEAMKLYEDAHPYLDEPEPALVKIVPELRGLELDSGHDQLSAVLAGVGAQIKELLHEVPNLVSDETVDEESSIGSALTAGGPIGSSNLSGAIGRLPADSSAGQSRLQEFNYIVLVHDTENKRILEEYRTDRKGKAIAQGPGAPNSVGFVSLWVVFSPANADKSRFRYVGQQKIGEHNTFVVAFAQKPVAGSHPGEITLPQGGTIPLLHQGVAWIDESDFRILRLRTDLLAPQPQVGLKQLTAMIQFGSVRIAKLGAQLWLPREVKLNIEANGQVIHELHQYSQYRLYKAKSKIVTGAP